MCFLCSARPACDEAGACRAEYPACRRSLQSVDLDAARQLFAWLGEKQGVGGPTLDRIADLVVGQLELDRLRFSETFEPSMSWSPDGWQLYRFSYAFPSFLEDREQVTQTIESMCAPFGDGVVASGRRIMAAARDRCVEQPIFGLAFDSPESWRAKLYLQFHDSAGDRPFRLVQRLTQCPDLRPLFPGRLLHLVGLDLAPGGMSAVKLYFLEHATDITTLTGPLASVELLRHLAGRGLERIVNLLTIHRMKGPDDPRLAQPVEVDFALAENELQYVDLAASETFRAAEAEEAPFPRLSDHLEVSPRRISVPMGSPTKLNIYYVLTRCRP